MLVHVGQRGPRHRLDPEVRKLAFAALQSLLDLTQAVRPAQLTEDHRNELLPAIRSPRMPLRIVLGDQLREVTARNKLENLTEQAAKCVHVEPFCGELKRGGTRSSLHEEAQRLLANLDGSGAF